VLPRSIGGGGRTFFTLLQCRYGFLEFGQKTLDFLGFARGVAAREGEACLLDIHARSKGRSGAGEDYGTDVRGVREGVDYLGVF